jgi:hypothetical protein
MAGQGIPLRAALKEFGLERALQRGDAARDGGMVGPEPPRCCGQAAGPRDRKEEAQIIPVEPTYGTLPTRFFLGVYARACFNFPYSRAELAMIDAS